MSSHCIEKAAPKLSSLKQESLFTVLFCGSADGSSCLCQLSRPPLGALMHLSLQQDGLGHSHDGQGQQEKGDLKN